MEDWNAIEAEYITTTISYREIARKYGLNLAYISKRGKRDGWVEKRRKHQAGIMAEALAADEQRRVERIARLRCTADLLLEKVERAISELDTKLCRQVEKEKQLEYDEESPGKLARERVTEKETLLQVPGIIDRQGLRQIASALRDIKEIQFLKSEQDAKEQAARIALLEKQADRDTVNEVEVVFAAGEEAWNE